MKRIVLFLLAAVALVSCEDKKNQKLDPNARVYINSAKMPQSAPQITPTLAEGEGQIKLSPLEVLKQADEIISTKASTGIGDQNRDIQNVRFIAPSIWVIDQYGELDVQFIESRDFIFVTWFENLEPKDTIAYIPNALMIKAEREVKAAYAAENYLECYRLLQEAFEFIPTTGAEYRELQKQGLN